LIDVLRPDSQHVVYAYDDVNRTAKVTSPVQGTDVVRQTTFFDPLGRPFKQQVTDLSNASYSITETQFDSWGRAYRVSNPHNSTAAYFSETDFDALSRPKTANLILANGTVVAGNSTSYTYSGASVTVTDPAGKQRKSKSDGLGRLKNLYEPDASNALTQNTDYTYSVLDGLLTVTQGVQTRTYTYDDLGHVLTVKTPESNQVATNFQYNTFGLLTQRTDPRGVVTTYSYDGLNRLYQTSYNVGSTGVPATPSVTLAYGTSNASNNNGRLLTATDGFGTETYTYDLLGRGTQLAKVISGTTYNTSYAYNLASELTQITYPSNRVVQQTYDAIGRLCAVAGTASNCTTYTSPFASGFGYNTAGMVTGFNYGNSVAASFGYTADTLQLQSLSYAKSGATLLALNYYYKLDSTDCPNAPTGNDGQIQCIKDLTGTQEAGRSVTYTYDGLSRLATAVTAGSTSYPQWGLSWTYDRYGNRTAQNVTAGTGVPSNSVAIDAATNRLTGSPYAYDANGNMTNDGANTLTYDAENQATMVAGATYSYDGNGFRVKKLSGGTTTVYLFSRSKVIAEYVNGVAPTSPTREYIYSGGALLAKIEAGATNYYHPDQLSARVISDSSGTSVGQRGHYPYGENWFESGTTTKLKFTTYERDSESGNDYAMARYHVNRLGRFSAMDTFSGDNSNPQSLNRYAYVQNDPVNLVDPLGQYIEVACDPGFQFHDSAEKPKTYTLWSCTWSQITGVRVYSYWDLMRNWRDMNPPDIGPPNYPAPAPLAVPPPAPPCDSSNGRPFDPTTTRQ
jgi:RHS repeat-associated protein